MGLAFWRSKKRAANAAGKPATRSSVPQDDDVDPRLDPAAGLRARARHRLIGAAALLLAVAIVVPMLLDPEPKPVAANIPIDIPSERTPFAPRLSLPPVAASDSAVTPPPDQAPGAVPAKAEPKAKRRSRRSPKPRPRPSPRPPSPRSTPRADERPSKVAEATAPTAVKGGKFAVQAAAPASEKSARELVDRLKKGGLASYTEKVETKDGTRYRVRVGPYATREDAETVRARLKSQGISGNLVTL